MSEGPKRLGWSGYLLGFALGGFFDGILLHQILQWHHLLSLVDGVDDMRDQVLFDGLFHALMYLIGAVGLVTLARSRRPAWAGPDAGRRLLANALIGFGAWHVADAVLSHWLLRIHRIRLGSPNPLAWDLFWLAIFGILPILTGLLIRRGTSRLGLSGRAGAAGLVLALALGGGWAARAPAGADSVIAIFRPDMNDGAVMAAITVAGGRVLWKSRGIWAVKWNDEARSASLYGDGAMLVSGSLIGAGCLAWTRV